MSPQRPAALIALLTCTILGGCDHSKVRQRHDKLPAAPGGAPRLSPMELDELNAKAEKKDIQGSDEPLPSPNQ